MMIAPHKSLSAAAQAAEKLSTIERQTRTIILEARKEAARITARARRRVDGPAAPADAGSYASAPFVPNACGRAVGIELAEEIDLADGAVVRLGEDSPVEIRAGGRLVARGRLGVLDGRAVLHVETRGGSRA